MKLLRAVALAAALTLTLALTAAAAPAVMNGPRSAGKSTTSQPATPTPAAPKVDINSADKPALVKLPGIGDAIADKIIAGRPWKKIDQLVSKKVLTAGVYAKIKSLIVAVQPK